MLAPSAATDVYLTVRQVGDEVLLLGRRVDPRVCQGNRFVHQPEGIGFGHVARREKLGRMLSGVLRRVAALSFHPLENAVDSEVRFVAWCDGSTKRRRWMFEGRRRAGCCSVGCCQKPNLTKQTKSLLGISEPL